jgi:hypothetical protein
MLRVVRRTAVTLLLMAAGLLVATPASACSCAGQTTREFFDRADAVFTARLVSREEPAPMTSSADPALSGPAIAAVALGLVIGTGALVHRRRRSAAGRPR